MSNLCILPLSSDKSDAKRIVLPYLSRLLKENSGNKNYELGCCIANKGKIHKATGTEVEKLSRDIFNTTDEYAGIFYENIVPDNLSKFYPESEIYPIELDENISFASCGNVLNMENWILTNSCGAIFADEVIRPLTIQYPNLDENKGFAWFLQNILRPYVCMAFLKKNGHITLINEHLFRKGLVKGSFYTDFEGNKNRYKTSTYSRNIVVG